MLRPFSNEAFQSPFRNEEGPFGNLDWIKVLQKFPPEVDVAQAKDLSRF